MDNLKKQFLGYINTPFLFKSENGLNQFDLDINGIEELDWNKLQITKKLTLGNRVEHFFKFYVNQSKKYDLIKNNIQIINNKHTFGELDFIIYDKQTAKFVHIEHVYKFYLYDNTIENEIDRYIGPNRNDTFVKKLTKLKEKQLPLLYKNETKEYLADLDINHLEQRVFFKGKIYVPFTFEEKQLPIINNACVEGFYINHKEFKSDKIFHTYGYFLPDKFDWVCDPCTNEIWNSFDEVIDEIELLIKSEKAPLVWLQDKKKNITKSFFVTWW